MVGFSIVSNPTHRVYDLIYFRTVLFSYYFDPLKVQIAGVPYLYIYIYLQIYNMFEGVAIPPLQPSKVDFTWQCSGTSTSFPSTSLTTLRFGWDDDFVASFMGQKYWYFDDHQKPQAYQAIPW